MTHALQISRRQALSALTLACCGCAASRSAPVQVSGDPVEQAVQRAHDEIWKRFIDPRFFTFYDYAGLDGTVILPTPEECAVSKPNALAWWTPIENGAFFGGLYLDALCNRWRARRDKLTAERAHRIAQGLVRLAVVGSTPGFIARGVAANGTSHYPAGSDDQTFPWFYGLWRYLNSGVVTKKARERGTETVRLMIRVAQALMGYRWRMPCDDGRLGFRGSFASFDYIHATRLLFLVKAMHNLTGHPQWLDRYQTYLHEKSPESGKTRLEICAEGALYESPGPNYKPGHPANPEFWTSASCQAGLRALAEMEADPAVRERFRQGLERNAVKAAEHVSRYREYDNESAEVFDVDWRFLNEKWRPQRTIDEAVKLAQIQVRDWNARSPKRRLESLHLREPLFAAWVVALSGNSELVAKQRGEIQAALTHYQWNRLHTSLFFIAENVHYEMQRYQA
ncbi:MAG: hypothetical protein AB1705_08015 [Verrucomicrobiota bacterium]